MLGEISRAIPLGGTAVVAEVEEYAFEVVDALMLELGGTVSGGPPSWCWPRSRRRRTYRQAQKEADRIVREQRKAERRQNAQERMAELKEKLQLA